MRLELRTSEWIAVAYFVYLAGTAVVLRTWRKRGPTPDPFFAAVVAPSIVALTFLDGAVGARVRDWLPLIYLPLGYWLPAGLVTHPNTRLEKRLLEIDCRLFGVDGLVRFTDRAPRVVIELLEAAYLLCYPIVPIGLACLVLGGYQGQVDRFWTAVLLAGYTCYGLLPWFPSRTPRAIDRSSTRSRSSIRALNLHVLGRASHQLNTFPSGHAAASIATALAVGAYMPLAGALLGLVAFGIVAGSVVGRYHYAADALTGAAVAIAAFALSAVLI